MKRTRLAILALLTLSACTAETPTPFPTIVPVRIAMTPALAPLGAALQACATTQTDTALQVDTVPANQMDFTSVDITFQLGETENLPAFVVPVAFEGLQVVLHPGLGNLRPDEAELTQLFSGQISDWDALGRETAPVEVWLPPEDADQRLAFDNTILSGTRSSPLARLAPDPQAMLEAVAQTPGSIGYLPAAFDAGELRSIPLDIRVPILALAGETPQGAAYNLLLCLQSEAGQQLLSQNYTPLTVDN